MAAGQTFESDLRALREARGLSLAEIHQQTRIPVDVLRRFESGALVQDPTYNEVYLKAFLQSYAKAVGLPQGALLVAYEDQKAGAYRGALRSSGEAADPAPDAPPAADEPPSEDPPSASESPASLPAAPERTPEQPPAPPRGSDAPPAVAALKNTPDPEKARRDEAPKTLAEARGNRPALSATDRSFDRNWTPIVGLFVVVLVVIAAALYVLVFAGGDGPETPDDLVADVETVGADAPDSSAAAVREPSGPAFQLPMEVAITAAGDGLQSFRVRVDDDVPRPYWVEIGDTQTFDADSVIVLFGEDPSGDFSEATLEIQGLRFTPPSGRAFTIRAANGQAVLDSIATATR